MMTRITTSSFRSRDPDKPTPKSPTYAHNATHRSVELGEETLRAAAREAREETGLTNDGKWGGARGGQSGPFDHHATHLSNQTRPSL